MSANSRISAEITAEQMATIQTQLQAIEATLTNVLIFNLTADERTAMLKMGDRNLAFVGKAIGYSQQNPSLVPSYLNVVEAEKDYKLAADLYTVYQQISHLLRSVEDSMMVAGGEAYEAALVFYNSVKGANRSNIPGTENVYNDLKQQFTRSKKLKETII
ncbi:hypothetical protein [Pedobacter nototheniae]|uniref:hypothetical protein n=1 Tax=Pedobacter nototheniae TaxID=2488994 RepID=UPI00103C9482|nr:hypothetical protein [Pedobacter nototheniae]